MSKSPVKRASRGSSALTSRSRAVSDASRTSEASAYSFEGSVDGLRRRIPTLLHDGYFDLPKRHPKRVENQYIAAVVESAMIKPHLRDKCQFYLPSVAPEAYQSDPNVSRNAGYELLASKRQTRLASSAVLDKAKASPCNMAVQRSST